MDSTSIDRFAAASGVDADTVWLAARYKAATVVTGTQSALAEEKTWRDLLARVATSVGRTDAETAWRAAGEEQYVDAERIDGYLATAIERLVETPEDLHDRHSMLPAAEIEAQFELCAGPTKPLPDRRFHELFQDRVQQHPDRVAAVQGDRSWTYAELNTAANKIAHSLHRQGLRAEEVVAVVTERTLEWLAAVIAVFKAGGCYLPLEPHYPTERFANVLRRSECRWVLADVERPNLTAAAAGVNLSYLDDLVASAEAVDDLDVSVGADQLAYIYFTSGSTGEPKGAMCEHAGFLNHLLAKIEDLGVGEGHVVAQTAPQCFDISLWQLVSPLLMGGRVHIVEQEVILDVHRFLDTLERDGIQLVQLVPSYLDVVLSTLDDRPRQFPALRCVAVTGEALKKELVQRWFAAFPNIVIVNNYGTTEVSDDTNHEVMDRVPAHRSVPLGRPLRNVRVYVMDEQLRLVPVGAQGEIVFAGVCVGRGYINDEARTKAAFGGDPYQPGTRLYRSGDFGRWLPSGILEYLGRRDSQVKINGLRIEIGEIENRLLQIDGVRDGAVVIAGTAHQPQLVGYYAGSTAPEPGRVSAVLAETLPGYMVPQRLYQLAELPLTANGKIDRKQLTSTAAAADDAGLDAPATDTERRIADLWSSLLRVPVDRIGRSTRFAELGGTSLTAIRLVLAMDRVVSVGELAATPTVAEVAALVDRKAGENR
jgi:amino acid adenylation domain-containing protein